MNFTRKWVAGLAFIATSSLFAIETATVGYTTKNLAAGEWAIIGTQFQDIETQTDVKLNDIITGTFTPGTASNYLTTAPQIQVQNDNNMYNTYYYIFYNGVASWRDRNGTEINTITIRPGKAFWFKSLTACDITTSGAIITTPSKEVSISNGWNLIANPYPTVLDINSEKISWGDLTPGTVSNYLTVAPQIQVQNGSNSYDTYYYISYDNITSWRDRNGTEINTSIAVGSGFWLKTTSNAKITFEQ